MQNPSRYLRLFDIKKYREIQPIIEGIEKRDASAEEVVSLLKAAIGITQTSHFRMYNYLEDSYVNEFQDILDVINTSNISKWFDMLDQKKYNGFDILTSLYSYICCPEYQLAIYEGLSTSGTTIEYEIIYYSEGICDLNLPKMLSSEYSSTEILPMEMKEESVTFSIFDQQQLILLDEAAKKDVLVLPQLNYGAEEYTLRLKNEYLKFYDSFNHLLDVIDSRPWYTFLMQEEMS